MIFDLDVFRAAKSAIRIHGGEASLYAAQRVDELMAAGDLDGRSAWLRIEKAIVDLQREVRNEGEASH